MLDNKPVYRWAGQLTPSGISAVPRKARLDPTPSEAVCPFCTWEHSGAITQHPQSWKCLKWGHALLHTPLLRFAAPLMGFFHSPFRAGFQSNGWQSSPCLITSTPPRVMCKCECPPGSRVRGTVPPAWAASWEQCGPEGLSPCAKHQQRPPLPASLREFRVLSQCQGRAGVLKAPGTSTRAVSSGCTPPWPPLPPVGVSVTHGPSPAGSSPLWACADWFPPRGNGLG